MDKLKVWWTDKGWPTTQRLAATAGAAYWLSLRHGFFAHLATATAAAILVWVFL